MSDFQRTVAEWMATGSDSPSDAEVAKWMDEAEDLLSHLWANGFEVKVAAAVERPCGACMGRGCDVCGVDFRNEAERRLSMAKALAPFGWTCTDEFWERYSYDVWVFNLANAVERLSAATPALVSTDVTYCVTHGATDHDDGRAWDACRFRQLFYFENPMDEHTYVWSDDA